MPCSGNKVPVRASQPQRGALCVRAADKTEGLPSANQPCRLATGRSFGGVAGASRFDVEKQYRFVVGGASAAYPTATLLYRTLAGYETILDVKNYVREF